MSLIILGGGRGKRLGQEKVTLVLNGEPLLQRIIGRLERLDEEIILVLAEDQSVPDLPNTPAIRTATDLHSGKGPLIGIYSGLNASRDDYSLVVACDMPFLNIDLLRYMRESAPGFDVVIPRIGSNMEPLHAVYSKGCLEVIKGMITEGDLKVANLLKSSRVRYIELKEINSFDPDHMSLFNINTRADLEMAERIVRGEVARS